MRRGRGRGLWRRPLKVHGAGGATSRGPHPTNRGFGVAVGADGYAH